MRVAYVLPMTWACGGTIVPLYQANGLAARGHEITIFAPSADEIDWFPLNAPVRAFSDKTATESAYDAVIFVGDTFRRLSPPGQCRFLLLQGKDYLWASAADRHALLAAYADRQYHVLAVSRWLADFVREKCDNPQVAVIGNGIDLERFFPDPKPHERLRLLVEGNFPSPNKNVLDALEVASRVRQHQNIEIWALGRRFASPGALVDKVIENPPQDLIPDIYRNCDLLIKTSITEGFGLPHLEAMASGCVPATYASGGVLDFCRHEENCLMTGVGNLSLLVGHVLRFLSDADLRRHLRANAIATARSRPWSRVVVDLEAALMEVPEKAS